MNEQQAMLFKRLKPYMPGLEHLGMQLIAMYPADEVPPNIAPRITVPIQLPAALLLIAIAKAFMPPPDEQVPAPASGDSDAG